jgi:threonine dehydratase
MELFTRSELDEAAQIVHETVLPTPAYSWPLLARRTGADVVVKHENHTPTGSFKARGGLVFVENLRRRGALPQGLVTATRGNHGQSIAMGADRVGIPAAIVVPEGNSVGKNAAMAAFGGEVIVAGRDFDDSRAIALELAAERGYQFVPSFHRDLVAGVATYALELFTTHPDLDVVMVPIGMGSGICGLISVRDMLGRKTEIIGVVAEGAAAISKSFDAGRPVPTLTARTFADGVACREPQPEAFNIIKSGAKEVLEVSDREIAEAMRALYTDTHNLVEGAGAAPLAALMKYQNRFAGRKVGLIQTGSNIDLRAFAEVLDGRTPAC